MRILTPAIFIAAAMALVGCDQGMPTGSQKETAATNVLMDQAATVVGVPAIKNFAEKRQLKMLYELRDQANLTTYSYYVDLKGTRHKICPSTSVGYGMPFSAQYTAPERNGRVDASNESTRYGTIYQPEPNGLYMPDSTSATWVICLGKDGKTLQPVYVEPQIIVSLTPMDAVN